MTREALSDTKKELENVKTDLAEKKRINEKKDLELKKVHEEKARIQKELEKVKQELSERLMQGWINIGVKEGIGLSEIPKNFEGWTVNFQDPYFRLFKKIDGKTKCIYLGRRFDIDKAKKKIKQKYDDMGIGLYKS